MVSKKQAEEAVGRWTAKRKVEVILSVIKGEAVLVDVCRKHDLTQSEVEGWLQTFLKSGEAGLKTNAKDVQDEHEREVKDLRAKVGELVLELEARKKLQALLEQDES